MAAQAVLSRRQAERDGKGGWNAEQFHTYLGSAWGMSIARQPLRPRESIMGTLRAGKDLVSFAWRGCGGGWHTHFDTLVLHELHTGTSVLSAAPIAPEQWRGASLERME